MKIHDELKAIKCHVCFKSFTSKSKLEIYYRTHTGEKPFTCQICEKKFAYKGDLVKHQATHSEVRFFECSICPEGRLFKTKGSLRNHMVFHYEPKLACRFCDHKSYSKYGLKRYETIHVKNKTVCIVNLHICFQTKKKVE